MKLIEWINGITKLNKSTMEEFQNNISEAIEEASESGGDGILTGSVIGYNGDTIPEGYEEVENNGGIVTVTNEKGTAIKYPDGTMICYGSSTETVKITNSYGSSYYANIDILFAETFVEKPTVTVTITASANIIIPAMYIVKTFSVGGFIQCAVSVTSEAITKNYIAIGRWK